jgi:hypothetical protein
MSIRFALFRCWETERERMKLATKSQLQALASLCSPVLLLLLLGEVS